MIDPEFDMQTFLTGIKSNIVDPDQSESMMSELMVYLILGGVAVLSIVCLFILGRYFFNKIKAKYEKIKKKMFFNGIIRSITISFFQVCLSIGIQIRMAVSNSKYKKDTEQYMALGMGIGCILMILVIICFLRKNYVRLGEPAMREKYGNMYKLVPLNRDYFMIYIFPAFLIHRLLFVLFPSTLFNFPAF